MSVSEWDAPWVRDLDLSLDCFEDHTDRQAQYIEEDNAVAAINAAMEGEQ